MGRGAGSCRTRRRAAPPSAAQLEGNERPAVVSSDIRRSLEEDISGSIVAAFRLIHSVNEFGLHQTAVYFECQTQFCDIPWPRERSAGTVLDSMQPVADCVGVADECLGRAPHGCIVVLLTARAPFTLWAALPSWPPTSGISTPYGCRSAVRPCRPAVPHRPTAIRRQCSPTVDVRACAERLLG